MVRGYAGDVVNLDALDEDGLRAHLKAKAAERGERFYTEESGGEWVAQFRSPNELAGEVVPVGDGAVILPGEIVISSASGPDRRTAMLHLAWLIAGEYG